VEARLKGKVDVVQSITGELEAGEARGTLSAIAARQRGSILIFYVVQFAIIGGGALGGYALGWAVDTLLTHNQAFDPFLMMFAGIVVGALVYQFYCRRLVVQRFRKRMSDRSLATRFRQTLTLNEDTVEMVSGSVHAVAPWSSVTEIFKAKGYWVLMVGMNAWFAPKRFFADETEERAFIRAALAHLGEGPRTRSKDAVTFAGS
jgi:hypothetical protein